MDPVLGAELLVKMAHVQVKVLLPVKPQHLLGLRQWHTLLAWPAATPVDQSVVAVFFIALSPTPHLSVADADDLRRLPPVDLLPHRSQDYFLHLHRPLHSGPRYVPTLSRMDTSSPPAKRTFHVLTSPDISCANDKGRPD